jgi:hypothetical protein
MNKRTVQHRWRGAHGIPTLARGNEQTCQVFKTWQVFRCQEIFHFKQLH